MNNQVQRSSTPCNICGVEDYSTSYSSCPEKTLIDKLGICFQCAFWEHRSSLGAELVIDHYVYSVGVEPKPGTSSQGLGMAGRRFDIEFISGPLTGQRFTTHNLWGGGKIPESWRDKLPNTARFVNGAEEAQVGEITCWNPSDPRAERYRTYQQIKRQGKI